MTRWRKSSYSGGQSNCVEVAASSTVVGLRDSKDPAGPALYVSRADFQAFVTAVKS